MNKKSTPNVLPVLVRLSALKLPTDVIEIQLQNL